MRRSYLIVAWGVLAALYLGLLYQNTPGVLTNEGVKIGDTDPYYRLYRIQQLVHEGLTYPLHDRNLSPPDGFDVPWPLGLDLLIALPMRILGITDRSMVESLSLLSIPLLALPTLFAVGAIGAEVGGNCLALMAGFLFVFYLPHIRVAEVGRIDHHVLEASFTTLALLALAYIRAGSRKAEGALVLLLAFGPSFWPQAWVLALFLALAFLIETQSESRTRASSLFLISSLLSLIPLSLSDRWGAGTISLVGFSWWSTFLYVAMALFFSIWSGRRRWSLLFFAIVSGILLWKNSFSFFRLFASSMISTLIPQGGLPSITTEAQSPLLFSAERWIHFGLVPLYLAWVWFLLQAFRRERWWIVGYALGPIVLGLLQVRFIAMAAPIGVLATAMLLYDGVVRIPWRWVRLSAAGISLLLISHPLRFPLEWTERKVSHPFFESILEASSFLRKDALHRGLSKEDRTVAAFWDYGHWLLYFADTPVVAHPFQSGESNELVHILYGTDLSRLEGLMEKSHARYLLTEAPGVRFHNYLRFVGLNPNDFYETVGNEIVAKASFYRLLMPRFFFSLGANENGELPSRWKLLSVVQRDTPGEIKIFEYLGRGTIR